MFFTKLTIAFSAFILVGTMAQADCLPAGTRDVARADVITTQDVLSMDMTKCDVNELQLANANLELAVWNFRNKIYGHRNNVIKASEQEKKILMPKLVELTSWLAIVKIEVHKRTDVPALNFVELYPRLL